jgi:hypothetical protein
MPEIASYSPVNFETYSADSDRILEHLEKGVPYSYGEFDVQDVMQWVFEGQAQLWYGHNEDDSIDSLIVTSKSENPTGWTLNIILWGGTAPEDWFESWSVIHRMALENGCNKIIARGRKGLLRRFRAFGMKEKYTVMEAEVNGNSR